MSLFETLQQWSELYPLITLLIIVFFAFIHPFIGGPLSLGVQTVFIAYFNSVWLGSLWMYGINIIGIFSYYYAIKNLKEPFFNYFKRKKTMKKILEWAEEKSPWQHTLALGLPFVYTYPVRIVLAMKNKGVKFTLMLSLSYLMLISFNLLMLYSIVGILLGTLPMYYPLVFFIVVLWLIYFGKQYLHPKKNPQK